MSIADTDENFATLKSGEMSDSGTSSTREPQSANEMSAEEIIEASRLSDGQTDLRAVKMYDTGINDVDIETEGAGASNVGASYVDDINVELVGDASTELSDTATSDEATSDEAASDEAARDEATNDAATSDAATSDAVTSGAAMSNEATRDAATRDEWTRDEATSDEPTSDEAISLEPVSDASRPKSLTSVKRGFEALKLREEVLRAILDKRYDKPTAIQKQTIPHVLAGRDLLGQAETGSGKTAAFACPLLSMIDVDRAQPQILVLAPTRELAIQVTEAIEGYASHLPGFRAATIYGGQSYDIQLRQLKRGVHVVVGTPGRVMDHMRRDTLKMRELKCLVLDEGDEMLRMGFVDDIEWILTMTPQDRQILLFSATLPEPIRRIAERHLKDPQHITVKGRNITADSIIQRFVLTAPREKMDMLTRILESDTTDGVIVFVKTRNSTVHVAEKLVDAGYSAAHLSGDMPQSHRERTVENFRKGKLAVLVATDVAARGLDVDRVSHVINYDFPHDVEAYVHRIGRTGRAGRSGQAILFVGHGEKGRLGRIEAETNQKLEMMHKPSIQAINKSRFARFKQQIVETATQADLRLFAKLVREVQVENDLSSEQIAAALAKLVQGDAPLEMKDSPHRKHDDKFGKRGGDGAGFQDGRGGDRGFKRAGSQKPAAGMQRYRIEVGRGHGVGPKNIVGAIANESGIDSSNIGRIEIHDLHSTIDLPVDLEGDFFRSLKGVKVGGQQLRLTRDEVKRFGKPGGKKDYGKRKFDKPDGAKNKSTVKTNGKGPFKAKAKKRREK